MTASPIKDLYNAPNGDRWVLCRNQAGKLVVCHHPNEASGGRASETPVELFLSVNADGPEYQALRDALAVLGHSAQAGGLPAEAADRVSRALGEAVARCWSALPQDTQQRLFEAAVRAHGEAIRQELAVYLHGRHDRTSDVRQTRAVPEPDSLGG
jgi:hypothetical protein